MYTALSHYHAAKSINEKLKSNVNEKNGKSKRETFIYEEDEYTLNSNVNPIAVKKAHIKESIASLEETQRLQRMSRDLKVSVFSIHFNLMFNLLLSDLCKSA